MLEIRDFRPEDRETYLSMAHTFYHSPAVDHPIPDSHFERTFAALQAGTPYARGLMLLWDGVPAGYGLLAITYSCEAGGLVVWAEELYIQPPWRRHGIGKGFFAFLQREYQGRAARIRLEVEPENTRAISLYQKSGYRWLPYRQMVLEFPPAAPERGKA